MQKGAKKCAFRSTVHDKKRGGGGGGGQIALMVFRSAPLRGLSLWTDGGTHSTTAPITAHIICFRKVSNSSSSADLIPIIAEGPHTTKKRRGERLERLETTSDLRDAEYIIAQQGDRWREGRRLTARQLYLSSCYLAPPPPPSP